MIYDKPPFAIATTAKTGIAKPKDLEGKVLGAPAADGAFAQWKAFVKENGIDDSKVKVENVGFPVREPMLADGKVDAITGFSFSMHYNLLQKGLKPEDIKTMLMADHGARALRQRHHGQSGLRQGQSEGGGGLRARDHQGRARHHQGPATRDQIGDERATRPAIPRSSSIG